MDVYQFNDYKSYVLKKIQDNNHIKGYRSKLAIAAGCGRSFLSQSLNSHIHLTLDHGAGLCQFWELDDERSDFFLDLMNYERAASQPLRVKIKKRLNNQRAASKRMSKRPLENLALSSNLKEALYYSAWHTAAVHMLTTVPGYQSSTAMAQRLELPSSLVERTLRDLQSIGLVEPKGKKWQVKGGSIHLPKESPLSTINQTNWRNQAMRHLGEFPYDGIHYSALLTLSKKDSEKIFAQLKEAIDSVITVVEPSEEEELVCFNLDYFGL